MSTPQTPDDFDPILPDAPGGPDDFGPEDFGPELARIKVSQPRRMLGVASMGVLGVLLLDVAFSGRMSGAGLQAVMALCGALALWASVRVWKATERVLILHEDALVDSTGAVLARIDGIARIERGTFAMKPSNGFMIRLDQPGGLVFQPGLWWRLGRRVAVGGMTAGSQTKPVADMLSAAVAERRPD